MPRQHDRGHGTGSPHGSHDDPSVLPLPSEQPSDDGAEELARRALAVVEGGRLARNDFSALYRGTL
jgi:hypothetical protein